MQKREKKEKGGPGPAVIWDSADMITVYGMILGIEAGRDEIRLLFGSRSVQTGGQESTVMVSDRIILNPFTAKRLLVFLKKTMDRHELPFEVDGSRLRAFMETTN